LIYQARGSDKSDPYNKLFMLSVLIPLYYLISESRRLLYQTGFLKPIKVSAYVISVGNITVGGTGKTTLTQYLANYFTKRGKKVVVISHGVSGRRDGLVVSNGKEILVDVRQAGDEAYLLAHNLPGIPVLSGRRREKQAQSALSQFGAEVIILDDAFHYLRLIRDHNILVFNCYSGLGNRRLLPAGPLREPLHNLKRADVFWFNHTDLVTQQDLLGFQKRLLRFNPAASVVTSYYSYPRFYSLSGETVPTQDLTGKKVWVCTGIGEPETFLKKLEILGIKVKGKTLFPDHHFYRKEEIQNIPLGEVDFLLITEKDRVKFPSVTFLKPVLYPKVELVVEGLKLC